MKRLLACALMMLASGASAQSVLDCGWESHARNIIEPYEAHSRTFANGDVRITAMDTVEPAAGAYFLMVLSPPFSELGDRQCRVIGMDPGIGFAGLDFQSLQAAYDPSVGLMFSANVQRYNPDRGDFSGAILRFTLNQATGEIGSWLE